MEREIVGMKMVGDYIACSNGKIFKLNWCGTGRTREVKQSYSHEYLTFVFNGKQILSHRFIAMCFLPNPDNLPQVNHKNEIKNDNRIENLEWCTAEYNTNYGTGTERAAKNRINNTSISKAVSQFTKSGQFVATYPSAAEAQRLTGILAQSICSCRNNRRKSAGGFIWR